MAEYLIYFNQQWVPDYPAEDWPEISDASKAVVDEIRAAGELVFAGGLGDATALAHADYDRGESDVHDGRFSDAEEWIGGLTLIDVADDERARYWARRIAAGCRWPQEVRRFKEGSMTGSTRGHGPEHVIYFNQQWVPDYPDQDWPDIADSARAVCVEIQEAGELVFTHGLEEEVAFAHADYANGQAVVHDGPFAETKEWIGGFAIVDVNDEDRARYWTRRIALGCRWPQEVRQFMPGTMRG